MRVTSLSLSDVITRSSFTVHRTADKLFHLLLSIVRAR